MQGFIYSISIFLEKSNSTLPPDPQVNSRGNPPFDPVLIMGLPESLNTHGPVWWALLEISEIWMYIIYIYMCVISNFHVHFSHRESGIEV